MRPTLEFVGVGSHSLEGIEGSVDVPEPLPGPGVWAVACRPRFRCVPCQSRRRGADLAGDPERQLRVRRLRQKDLRQLDPPTVAESTEALSKRRVRATCGSNDHLIPD
jgi:hypothetical protein